MVHVRIEAKPDYVLRLAKQGDPVGAVAEIIWNGLDADATKISVELVRNDVGGIEAVNVTDNGSGMPRASIDRYFSNLGGSWKATALVSANLKRTLHGKTGHGRLRAFALGDLVRWSTIAVAADGNRERTSVSASVNDPTDFEISDPSPVDDSEETGTVVSSRLGGSTVDRLSSPAAVAKLTAAFAPFLSSDPTVKIEFDGKVLDPSAAWLNSALYRLSVPPGTGSAHRLDESVRLLADEARLRVIEWSEKVPRKIALCDSRGVELGEVRPGIHAPGVNFTAYLQWDGFRAQAHELSLADFGDTEFEPLLESARRTLKDHLASRERTRRREQVERWKSDQVYPYTALPVDAAEGAEREVFDEVATTIAARLPRSAGGQKATLRLLREALAHNTGNLMTVLDEVFRLSKPDREALERLLQRTSLSNIVQTSSQVADRLDFLAALRLMTFDPETAGKVRERAELHKILLRELWVFGDEFHLMVSDQSLDEVLRRHLDHLGRSLVGPQPVRRDDGTVGIVDLMLGRARRGSGGREHLIVELKAPRVKIGGKEVTQIKSYAEAVVSDPQFRDAAAKWEFMIVSTDMDKLTRLDATAPNRAPGCIAEWDNGVRIWAKTWSDIIEECEQRLHYYRERLNHDAAAAHGEAYLSRVHPDFLPRSLQSGGRVQSE
jgi:hypothetical protein